MRDVGTQLAFSRPSSKGCLPTNWPNASATRRGNLLFGLDYPEAEAILSHVTVEPTRKAFWLAFNQRGGKTNLDLMQEAVTLRLELAQLMGKTNYADWVTERKMAGSAQAVNRFLDDVQGRVGRWSARNLMSCAREKVRLTGDANATLQRWDVSLMQERLKQSRYSVDQREVRAQFPTQPTIDWMLKVSADLYGLDFRANPKLPVWQSDVRGYDVYDRASGK